MGKSAHITAESAHADRPLSAANLDSIASAKHRAVATAAARVLRRPWLLGGLVLAIACLAAGVVGGSMAAQSKQLRAAHQGACAAIQMAAAHGYLDVRQQRMVMRALTTAVNPDVDLFPGGYRAMRESCGAGGDRP